MYRRVSTNWSEWSDFEQTDQPFFFTGGDFLFRGDLTGVIRGTIFVQLYKTRHEQVLDSILRSKTKILLQVPTLGVLRLGQKKRFRKWNSEHEIFCTADAYIMIESCLKNFFNQNFFCLVLKTILIYRLYSCRSLFRSTIFTAVILERASVRIYDF